MRMIQEDLIRQRLNDPRVLSIVVKESNTGVDVGVEIKGSEKHVRRIAAEHFDVDSVLESADAPTHAMLRPKW